MKPFEQVIDGRTWYCVAFGSEEERAAVLSGAPSAHAPPAPTPAADETRPPGRPSFDDLIAAAMQPIEAELEGLPTLAARARRVLEQIAQDADPADIPSRDTVERFLRDRPTRKKDRQNYQQNSRRVKVKSGG